MIKKVTILIIVLILASSIILGTSSIHFANANTTTTINIDSTGCGEIGGSWDSGSSTCYLSNSYTIGSGDEVLVPVGTTLNITSFGTIEVQTGGTLFNDGTVDVSSGGGQVLSTGLIDDALGIFNDYGLVASSGTLQVEYGDFNVGSFTVPGTLNSNAPIINTGTFNVMYGTVTSSSSFSNQGALNQYYTFNNLGTLNSTGSISNYGTLNNTGTVFNYGSFQNGGTVSDTGFIYEECGATMAQNTGTNPFFVDDACQGSFSGISTLSNDLSNDFSSLQSSLSSISASLSTDFNSLSSSLSNDFSSLSSAIAGVQTTVDSISTSVSNLQSSLASDFNALSSAISKIGVTGPTVGTSNDATVSTSPTFSSKSSFSTNQADWVLVSAGSSSDTVIAGYTLSLSSGSVSNGVLYISVTNTPSGPGSTYAVPIGNIASPSNGAIPISGNLRFPFHIPAGDSVYVQLVSSKGSSVVVQLQSESLPINP